MNNAANKNLKRKSLPRARKIQVKILSVKRADVLPRNFVLNINTLDGIVRKRKPVFAKTIFNFKLFYSVFKKSLVFGVIVLTALGQASMFAAFESHIINVTATIENRYCADFEARTIGFWKNHEEEFEGFLPIVLGGVYVETVEAALDIFDNNSVAGGDATPAVKAQLLALKFNVLAFGIGDYFVASAGKTVSEIIAEADAMLQNPDATFEELLAMKDLIDYINNLSPDIGCNIVINKIYYDVAPDRGAEGDNEWIELYNKTDEPVDVSGWTLCDNKSCDVLPASPSVPAEGFAVITGATTTLDYWHIPDSIVKIILADGKIGNGLHNDNDMLSLTSSDGTVMDRMNYGTPDPGWNHYNALNVWNPGAVDVAEGNTLARSPIGYDTNQPGDFVELGPPTVDLIYPDEDGSYTWYWTYDYDIEWTAANPNGDDEDLSINLYWIRDDDADGEISGGDTTNLIVEGTENDGVYNWTVPSGFLGYIWIKIVAVGPENPMLSDISISGDIWDPPTPELLAALQRAGAFNDVSVDALDENPQSNNDFQNEENTATETIVENDNDDGQESENVNDESSEETREIGDEPGDEPGETASSSEQIVEEVAEQTEEAADENVNESEIEESIGIENSEPEGESVEGEIEETPEEIIEEEQAAVEDPEEVSNGEGNEEDNNEGENEATESEVSVE